MSANASRPRKSSKDITESTPRAPMFEVRHDPLRQAPSPLQGLRDPFEDLDDIRPRTARPQPASRPAPPRAPEPLQRVPPPRLAAPAAPARDSLPRRMNDLHHAETLARQLPAPRAAYSRVPSYEPAGSFVQSRPWLLAMVALVSVLVVWFASADPKTTISSFTGGVAANSGDSLVSAFKANQVNTPDGEHSLLGAPSISAQFIDQVLAHYGSPAAGTGAVWVEMGQRYGIDPAYALAFFIHESSAGTNPGWAGVKPGGGTTHNVGNIICAGYSTCFGRFRDYATWDEGIEDWYKLIAKEYVNDRGVATIEQIIPIYAPSFENDVGNYVGTVVDLADAWRQGVVR